MNVKKLTLSALLASLSLATVIGSIAIAEPAKDAKPAAAASGADAPAPQLPPGWTEADMKAMMEAGTPGKMHEYLAKGHGTWQGKSSSWMTPDMKEPILSEVTVNASPMMDGRYTKLEIAGDMPGCGPWKGFGLFGYDNVAKQFVTSWIDSHSTGIMQGTGALSPDQKSITWDYTYHCPLTQKPARFREVETVTGPNTKTLEMFGADPKSGKEFKMMRIELTKK
ncbi:MAG: DUF1579 family protein [Tepidisphaeraceae bacterium]